MPWPNETCPHCGSKEFLIARDMKATRRCDKCDGRWLPLTKGAAGMSDGFCHCGVFDCDFHRAEAKDRRIAELERELGSEREARKVAEARAYELEREWFEEARAMVDEADRKTSARISDACIAKDKRIAELEREVGRWWSVLCQASDALGGPTPEKAPYIPNHIRDLVERIAELESRLDEMHERHERQAPIVNGLREQLRERDGRIAELERERDATRVRLTEVMGAFDRTHARHQKLREALERISVYGTGPNAVADIARRALAEDKEQGDGR